jgi:pyridinium-3,5-biscarboxylic acid mononucleotide sulfurtransferase
VPPGADLRCRITHAGVVIEASETEAARTAELIATARDLCREKGRLFAGLRPYRRGAAFLHSGR